MNLDNYNVQSELAVPPHNSDAERSVLGACMLDETALSIATDKLKDTAFYYPAHRIIFAVIVDLVKETNPVDSVTVISALMANQNLESCGGATYLAELIDAVPTTANIEHYVKLVREKWMTRELIGMAQKIVGAGMSGTKEFSEILEIAERDIFQISQGESKGSFANLNDTLAKIINELEEAQLRTDEIAGVDTGFMGLNQITTGFKPGQLIILAARPGMGKTALALNIAENVALGKNVGFNRENASKSDHNKAVAIFSLEMTPTELMKRMLASHAKIDGQEFRKKLSKKSWPPLVQSVGILTKTEIYIDGSSDISPLEIRARCRRLKAEKGNLSLIIVDYIQLMSAGTNNPNNREQEVAFISRQLKAMAQELEVPVIALSQLNRESEKGTRPQLNNLRESGAIEQDADVVMLLYRPGYYNDDEQYQNDAELIIAKQRSGPTGTVYLLFHNNYARFEDPSLEQLQRMKGRE